MERLSWNFKVSAIRDRNEEHTSVEGATDCSNYDLNCIETTHQIEYRSLLVIDSMDTDNVNSCHIVRFDLRSGTD